ncbi:hypothetical protein GNI_111830 [Gregarina niphandrodes]|uniref:Uncharacterized protein n=1 Tax=Gregarina niphandrodes TaxID=110365 RepID=A0A023B3G4_GRENI|nr:hypothetical protein GNI_111830 [Gregarina niphandrodes]EZG55488.1 hypothetical protein GNI_111830 [Gregarina niphandrodes]|eukprot:XP_011131532.1 hypothetical protein GNI_111830 [Gregarina niphandrodes]
MLVNHSSLPLCICNEAKRAKLTRPKQDWGHISGTAASLLRLNAPALDNPARSGSAAGDAAAPSPSFVSRLFRSRSLASVDSEGTNNSEASGVWRSLTAGLSSGLQGLGSNPTGAQPLTVQRSGGIASCTEIYAVPPPDVELGIRYDTGEVLCETVHVEPFNQIREVLTLRTVTAPTKLFGRRWLNRSMQLLVTVTFLGSYTHVVVDDFTAVQPSESNLGPAATGTAGPQPWLGADKACGPIP